MSGHLGQLRHRKARKEAEAKAPAFWVANVESRHFSFEAYGTTADSAMVAMRRLLEEHAAITLRGGGPAIDGFVNDCMAELEPQERYLGEGYRDGECLTGQR